MAAADPTTPTACTDLHDFDFSGFSGFASARVPTTFRYAMSSSLGPMAKYVGTPVIVHEEC